MTPRLAGVALLSAVALVAVAGRVGAQAQPKAGDVRVLPLRGNIYLLTVGGVNIAASVGKDGVLLVDSGPAAMSEMTLATVRELSRRVTAAPMPLKSCVGMATGCQWWSSSELLPTTAGTRPPRPIAGIVNTSDDPDHVGGNAVISAAGRTFGVRNIDNTVPGAWVVAHESVALRLTKAGQQSLVANETYFGNEKKLNFFNGEGVVISHPETAHTDGDSMVYFRGSDVLVAGDVLDMTRYPVIDLERGGSVQGEIDALNWILDLAVVEHMMEGGTLIVPGHGRMTDAADVAYYRDMVTIVRDRVREMTKRGMTLAQIKAARLTRDYDPRFGKSASWTPDMFIEAVYRSLAPKS
jgi:glyoxylase-like metal-dependent hydrolase (beta-lactamase superfamily II)